MKQFFNYKLQLKSIIKLIISILIITDNIFSNVEYKSETLGLTKYNDGIPRFVHNINYKFDGFPEEIATRFLAENSNFLFPNESPEFKLVKIIHNPAGHYILYLQIKSGVPVLGSETIIGINNKNKVVTVANGFIPIVEIPNITPTLNENDAINIGMQILEIVNHPIQFPPEPRLGIIIDLEGNSILVWELFVVSEQFNGDWYLLLDAHSGKLIVKNNIAMGIVGSGTVWDPNPSTLLEDTLLSVEDDNFENLVISSANVSRDLLGLNESIDGYYYVQGEFAHSEDIWSPHDSLAQEESERFFYTHGEEGFEEVNIYYHLDKMIRYVRSLGFNPLWNNALEANSQKLMFDARVETLGAYYKSNGDFLIFSVTDQYPDAGEDESVIIH